MTAIFNLIDVESGNLVGSYDSEEEARAIAQASFLKSGEEGFRGLALLRVDERGRQTLVAEEAQLLQDKGGVASVRHGAGAPAGETTGE